MSLQKNKGVISSLKKRLAPRALTALILCCLLLSLPASVSAHAYVVTSTPGENEVLQDAPTSISITFNEPIENAFHSIQVTDPSGQQAVSGESRIDGGNSATLLTELRPNLPDGIYTVNYKVLSSDGHTVTGTFPFIIGDEAAKHNTTASNEPGSSGGRALPGTDLLLVRWLQYSGLALYMGTLLFHLVLLPRRSEKASAAVWQHSKRLLMLSLILAAAGIGLSLPQQTASDAGVPWGQAWNPALLKDTLQLTSFGNAWLSEMVLLLLLAGLTVILAVFAERSRLLASWGTVIALMITLGILLAKSFIGHAAAANEKSMAIAMNFLHQASSFMWLGGLLSLVCLLPAAARALRDKPDSKNQIYWETIRRFSILAACCVIILLSSGIYAGLLYVPTWHALLNSNYGLVLLIKAGLTLIMLILGLSAFLRGRKQSRPLGAGVWLEFGIGLIVLVVAAILSNMPTALSSPGPVHLKGTTPDGYHVAVKVTPNVIGQNNFEVTVHDHDQKPLHDIEQITLTLTSLSMDMGTIEFVLPKGESVPLTGNGLISMGGRWSLHVHILLSSLETIDSRFAFEVGTEK